MFYTTKVYSPRLTINMVHRQDINILFILIQLIVVYTLGEGQRWLTDVFFDVLEILGITCAQLAVFERTDH